MPKDANHLADPQILSGNLRKIRQIAHLTQAQCARKLGVSVPTYNNWENGNRTPKADNLAKMVEIFGVRASLLLDAPLKDFKDLQELVSDPAYSIPLVTARLIAGKIEIDELKDAYMQCKRFDTSLLNTPSLQDFFAFKVESEDMETRGNRSIPNGSFAICTTKFNAYMLDDSPYVVSIKGGMGIIRELEHDQDQLVLKPWNPTFGTRAYATKDIHIFGKVLKSYLSYE